MCVGRIGPVGWSREDLNAQPSVHEKIWSGLSLPSEYERENSFFFSRSFLFGTAKWELKKKDEGEEGMFKGVVVVHDVGNIKHVGRAWCPVDVSLSTFFVKNKLNYICW